MTHTATLVIEPDSIDVKFTCNAGADAKCHQVPFGECWCEQFTAEKRDGQWGHYVYTNCDLLHTEHNPDCAEQWHPMRSAETCNYIEWVTNDARPEELYCGKGPTALNETPIEFVWQGDFFEWREVSS